MSRYYCGNCFKCNSPLDFLEGNVGRGESCPVCRSDVRTCLNCKHFNPHCYNECEEPIADRVLEKHRSNFCDMFRFVGGSGQAQTSDKNKVMSQLDDLFKKPT